MFLQTIHIAYTLNVIVKNKFVEWLNEEIRKRGWNYSELARRMDVVPSTVSMVASEQKQPGTDFCLKLSYAFSIPPEDVYRRAGFLPPLPLQPDLAQTQELVELFRRMSEGERTEVLDYARYRYQRAQSQK